MGLSVVSSEYEEIRKQRLEANQRRLQVYATSHWIYTGEIHASYDSSIFQELGISKLSESLLESGQTITVVSHPLVLYFLSYIYHLNILTYDICIHLDILGTSAMHSKQSKFVDDMFVYFASFLVLLYIHYPFVYALKHWYLLLLNRLKQANQKFKKRTFLSKSDAPHVLQVFLNLIIER